MGYYYRAGEIHSMVTEYQQPLEYQPHHLGGHKEGSHTPPPWSGIERMVRGERTCSARKCHQYLTADWDLRRKCGFAGTRPLRAPLKCCVPRQYPSGIPHRDLQPLMPTICAVFRGGTNINIASFQCRKWDYMMQSLHPWMSTDTPSAKLSKPWRSSF